MTEQDPSVRLVSRREAMAGTGLALGSLVASGSLTETVLAQSGGPSDEISGTVEDEMGAVSGATVVAVPHDTSLAALETTTAADGTYIFKQSDLHEGTNLYHVIARDGIESDPRRGVPNYPFIAAEGAPSIPDSGGDHQWNYVDDGDLTVADEIGTIDAAFSGATWQTGAGVEDTYLSLDGTDDYGDLGSASQSELAHFINTGQGTLFKWIRPAPNPSENIGIIYGTDISGSVNNIWLTHYSDADSYRWFGGGGSSTLWDVNPSTGTTVDDWVALAATCDGSTARLFIAEPSGYDVTELGSGSISGTNTGDLAYNVNIGRETESQTRYFEGDIDLGFTDTVAWTQSELQTFVDDSKHHYA